MCPYPWLIADHVLPPVPETALGEPPGERLHQAEPAVSIPHCASRVANTCPPDSTVGVVVPFPQQYAAPAVVSAQLCDVYTDTAFHVVAQPRYRAVGTCRVLFVLSPSWPDPLYPQQ